MQMTTICILVTALCAGLSSAQGQGKAAARGGGRRQRGGGEGPGRGGEGPFGDSGPVVSAIMNDPFAFRRWSHPLANQRFMNSFYQPNFATMSLLMGDMEPLEALFLGAMSGVGMHARGPGRRQQWRPDPLLVALGIGDGLDVPDGGRRGQRRGEWRRRRVGGPAKGPAKAPATGPANAGGKRKRGRGARSEAGAAGQSEVA